MAEDEKQVNEAEAEGAEGAEGESVAPSGLGGKKLILLMALGAVMIGSAVAGIVFFFFSAKEEDPLAAAVMEVERDPSAELSEVAFFQMPQMTVNLLAQGDQTGRFLKLKVALELESDVDLEAVEKVLPRLQDDFQTFLRQLRLEDIKGSAGMHRLREGLLLRAQQSAAPARVRNVLFKEITVQ